MIYMTTDTTLVRVSYVVKNTLTGSDYPKQVVGLILSEDNDFLTIKARDGLIFRIRKSLINEIKEVLNHD